MRHGDPRDCRGRRAVRRDGLGPGAAARGHGSRPGGADRRSRQPRSRDRWRSRRRSPTRWTPTSSRPSPPSTGTAPTRPVSRSPTRAPSRCAGSAAARPSGPPTPPRPPRRSSTPRGSRRRSRATATWSATPRVRPARRPRSPRRWTGSSSRSRPPTPPPFDDAVRASGCPAAGRAPARAGRAGSSGWSPSLAFAAATYRAPRRDGSRAGAARPAHPRGVPRRDRLEPQVRARDPRGPRPAADPARADRTGTCPDHGRRAAREGRTVTGRAPHHLGRRSRGRASRRIAAGGAYRDRPRTPRHGARVRSRASPGSSSRAAGPRGSGPTSSPLRTSRDAPRRGRCARSRPSWTR